MEEDIKIVKEIKKEFITKMKKDITHNDNPIYYRNIQALQNILNELEKSKDKLTLIAEVCVDESKLHIESSDAIKEIKKILKG